MKILVINGPNINMLGVREPDIYGKETYADLVTLTTEAGKKSSCDVDFFQSNHEGAIVDKIQEALGVYDGIVINPAAYTHTSIAILDALKAVGIPTVEVHISDVDAREDFRQTSYVSLYCEKRIIGEGIQGYAMAVDYLAENISTEAAPVDTKDFSRYNKSN